MYGLDAKMFMSEMSRMSLVGFVSHSTNCYSVSFGAFGFLSCVVQFKTSEKYVFDAIRFPHVV